MQEADRRVWGRRKGRGEGERRGKIEKGEVERGESEFLFLEEAGWRGHKEAVVENRDSFLVTG